MTKKRLFKSSLVIVSLLLQFNLLAQAPPVTLHVETAGTLPLLIAENEKYEITDLMLTGNLNGTDIRYIREMAGRGYEGDSNNTWGSETNGKLTKLDLSGANIVSGGDYYLNYYSGDKFYTGDNQISKIMFGTCQKLETIILPESVIYIGDNAFGGCVGLTSVTIGNRVASIGVKAFSDCTGLTEIHSKNPTPPTLYTILSYGCFNNVDKTTCKLYVPKGSKSAYQSRNGWSEFANIIEEDVSAINPVNKDNISIRTGSIGIYIETKEQTPVTIYNLSGQKVYQNIINGNTEIRLNKGVYILKVNNESKKIMIK